MDKIQPNSIVWIKRGFQIFQDDISINVEVISEGAVSVYSKTVFFTDNNTSYEKHTLNKTECSWKKIIESDSYGIITGDLKIIYENNKLIYFYRDKKVLSEYSKKSTCVKRTIAINDDVPIDPKDSSPLNINSHEYRVISENEFHTKLRFESDPNEFICGLGGYQDSMINKNGGQYELMQRNTQTSIPMYLSNKKYGFIWNNSGIGEVHFSKKIYQWESYHTQFINYVVFVGEDFKRLLDVGSEIIGKAPCMPEKYLGLWQSKLRYQTTKELEQIYESYVDRGIKLSVLVIDYFHWTEEGDFEFDYRYWNGISNFADKCRKANTELMVSVWPTVTESSKYFDFYSKNNMLITGDKNKPIKIFNDSYLLDFSNENTRKFLNNKLCENYITENIDLFWADQAEPEMNNYQHNMLNSSSGNFARIANKYPVLYLDSIPKDNKETPVLIRSVWLGSQSKGAISWSGDIVSSFEALEEQIQIVISMGISGQAWWTSDIGGFHAYTSDIKYNNELMIRWFQFSTFTPILRMHGDRQPHYLPMSTSGGGIRTSGSDNEIWSFGRNAEKIMTQFIRIRENLKSYIYDMFTECHKNGLPLVRPLFIEYPNDANAWQESNTFLFGRDVLVSPVVTMNCRQKKVYIPYGDDWIHLFSEKIYVGGEKYNIDTPIEEIPVFIKKNSKLAMKLKNIL